MWRAAQTFAQIEILFTIKYLKKRVGWVAKPNTNLLCIAPMMLGSAAQPTNNLQQALLRLHPILSDLCAPALDFAVQWPLGHLQ